MSDTDDSVRINVPGNHDADAEGRTPGPWFVESHGIMDATRSRTICLFGDSDQDSADARLVAAAPELLRLLSIARECEGLQEWVPALCDEIDAISRVIDRPVTP